MTGNVDNMSPNEIKDRLQKILDENKQIINITPEDVKLEELKLPKESNHESDQSSHLSYNKIHVL